MTIRLFERETIEIKGSDKRMFVGTFPSDLTGTTVTETSVLYDCKTFGYLVTEGRRW